jgi:hypothetical protein
MGLPGSLGVRALDDQEVVPRFVVGSDTQRLIASVNADDVLAEVLGSSLQDDFDTHGLL